MDSVQFTKEQLNSLLVLTESVRAARIANEVALAQVGPGEAASLGPVYQDLVNGYANGGTVSEAQLATYVPKLDAARVTSYGATDPRQAHYASVSRTLARVSKWVETLPLDQQTRLGECRFFLQRRLGPFTNPGDYEKWLGTAWNGSDFASLRAGGRPVDEGQMDIGGLWADDASFDQSLPGLRVAVLLLFAMQEDDFVDAVQVRLGARDPADYTPKSDTPAG